MYASSVCMWWRQISFQMSFFHLDRSQTDSESQHFAELSGFQTGLLTRNSTVDQPRPTWRFTAGSLNVLIKTILSFDMSDAAPCFGWWLSDAVSSISRGKLVDFFQRPRVNSHATETLWLLLWVTNHCVLSCLLLQLEGRLLSQAIVVRSVRLMF